MEKLKRILGLDVGDKRIGVAVSDELGLTAQPVMTLERQSLEKDCAALNALIQKYEISKIVVGIPRSLSMKITPQTQAKKTEIKSQEVLFLICDSLNRIDWP